MTLKELYALCDNNKKLTAILFLVESVSKIRKKEIKIYDYSDVLFDVGFRTSSRVGIRNYKTNKNNGWIFHKMEANYEENIKTLSDLKIKDGRLVIICDEYYEKEELFPIGIYLLKKENYTQGLLRAHIMNLGSINEFEIEKGIHPIAAIRKVLTEKVKS